MNKLWSCAQFDFSTPRLPKFDPYIDSTFMCIHLIGYRDWNLTAPDFTTKISDMIYLVILRKMLKMIKSDHIMRYAFRALKFIQQPLYLDRTYHCYNLYDLTDDKYGLVNYKKPIEFIDDHVYILFHTVEQINEFTFFIAYGNVMRKVERDVRRAANKNDQPFKRILREGEYFFWPSLRRVYITSNNAYCNK